MSQGGEKESGGFRSPQGEGGSRITSSRAKQRASMVKEGGGICKFTFSRLPTWAYPTAKEAEGCLDGLPVQNEKRVEKHGEGKGRGTNNCAAPPSGGERVTKPLFFVWQANRNAKKGSGTQRGGKGKRQGKGRDQKDLPSWVYGKSGGYWRRGKKGNGSCVLTLFEEVSALLRKEAY